MPFGIVYFSIRLDCCQETYPEHSFMNAMPGGSSLQR